MIAECVAYTYEHSRFNCNIHSSTAKGQKFFRGKQTGLKKANYTLSLPEISYCSEKNRKRRCRREPKCSDVDCFRIASDFTRPPKSLVGSNLDFPFSLIFYDRRFPVVECILRALPKQKWI